MTNTNYPAPTGYPNNLPFPPQNPASNIVLVQQEPRGPSQLIEIAVPTTATQRVPFPDVQQLRSQEGQRIIIKSLRLITPKILTNGVTVAGTNAPLAELRKISVVLYSEGWNKGNMIPILTFSDFNDSDATAATTIPFRNAATRLNNWVNVDWPQSYLLYANGTAPASTPYVVIFDCEYEKLDKNGRPIVGPS